ncbi:hypothetical protein [Cupriavidus necator]
MLGRDEAKNGIPNIYKHFGQIDRSRHGAASKVDIGACRGEGSRQRQTYAGRDDFRLSKHRILMHSYNDTGYPFGAPGAG